MGNFFRWLSDVDAFFLSLTNNNTAMEEPGRRNPKQGNPEKQAEKWREVFPKIFASLSPENRERGWASEMPSPHLLPLAHEKKVEEWCSHHLSNCWWIDRSCRTICLDLLVYNSAGSSRNVVQFFDHSLFLWNWCSSKDIKRKSIGSISNRVVGFFIVIVLIIFFFIILWCPKTTDRYSRWSCSQFPSFITSTRTSSWNHTW